MKSLLIAVLICMTPLALGQAVSPTPTPTPAPEPNVGVHFEAFADYVQFTDGKKGTVIGARLPITPRWSAVYSQYQIPDAKAQLYLVGPRFDENLCHIVKSSAIQVNLCGISVFAQVDAGTKRDDLGNHPQFAYGVHGGGNIPIGKVGGGTLLLGLKAGIIRIPRNSVGPKTFSMTTSGELVPGVFIRF